MRLPSMKVVLVLLGLPLIVAVADWAWTQGPVSTYKNTGPIAYYSLQEDFAEGMGSGGSYYGNRSVYVEVSQMEMMGSGGTGTAFRLYYDISISTRDGYGDRYGSGLIPASCVTQPKPENQNLMLKVDTNLLTDSFYSYTYGDIEIPAPEIDLYWKRTGNDWNRWEGHQVREMGALVEHSQGSGVQYYTIPTGSVSVPDVGYPVVWTYMNGYLGVDRSKSTLIQRGPR
jgi:hypothetical protein